MEATESEVAENTWYAQLPARIGYDECVDLSLEALVVASRHGRGLPAATPKACYSALASAFRALQRVLSTTDGVLSEESVVCIALLTPFESMMARHSLVVPVHVQGMTAVLTRQAFSAPASSIVERIITLVTSLYCRRFAESIRHWKSYNAFLRRSRHRA